MNNVIELQVIFWLEKPLRLLATGKAASGTTQMASPTGGSGGGMVGGSSGGASNA